MKKVALVTGSSRGIGRAVAAELARDGYAVCINYYERKDKADELVALLRAEGREAIAVQADVSKRSEVNAMVAQCERELGKITLLVNNAGVAGQALFQDVTDEMWERYFGVNLNGARNTIQAVLPNMLHEKSGCIVNISSIWGQHVVRGDVFLHEARAHRPDALARDGAGAERHPRQLRCPRRHRDRYGQGTGRGNAQGPCRANAARPPRQARGHRRGGRVSRV